MFKVSKVGGLYHWRIGRVGGSFYIAKRKPAPTVDYRALIASRLNL